MTRPAEETWREHTDPFDRVQSVVFGVSEPQSAEDIAEDAAVSVGTARNHLESLVDIAVVLKHDSDDQPSYSPDPLYTRLRAIRGLIDAHDRDGLIEIRDELQAQIDAWRDEYGVDSPDELRNRDTMSDASQDTNLTHRPAKEWELIEYRLSIVIDAITRYHTYTTMD